MTGPRIVVVVEGGPAVGGGAEVAGADPVGTLVAAVDADGTDVGTTEPVVGDVELGDATTEVVEVPRFVCGTDVLPSSPEEHAARTIAMATPAHSVGDRRRVPAVTGNPVPTLARPVS